MESIKSQSIIPRIDGVEKDISKLEALGKMPLIDFSQEDNFIKAQFYLRKALEGVFHIGSHILSRIPGGRATEYKEVALKLGEHGIVEENFAKTKLKDMAGYRNRLTHFYAEITPEEIYKIIHENLPDFKTFLDSIKTLLKNPQKFGLTLE